VEEHVSSDSELEEIAPKSSRKRFLRQLGMTLAAAIGAGTFAKSAFAFNNCCKNCASCGTCSGGCWCFCDCSGAGTQSYCSTVSCLSAGCVTCPC
jgi:hypothetical protein